MSQLGSVYQQYLSNYGNNSLLRYETHKKSQLRDTYNRIVKLNKDSPLYKIPNAKRAAESAINIKESARNIQKIVASLTADSDQSMECVFQKKVATTSDESIVSAEYLGSSSDKDTVQGFEIEVRQLASPQINVGNFLDARKTDLQTGTYSFDLNTVNNAYEFQFNVGREDDNNAILHKIASLITNAEIGLRADVISNDEQKIALRITSNQTGISEDGTSLFQIMPQADNPSIHSMNVLGIDRIAAVPTNAQFVLNGNDCESWANTFTVNDVFRLTLKDVSPENETVTVGFKTNADAIADNIEQLTDAYNQVLSVGEEQATAQSNPKLLKELIRVSFSQKSLLESVGLEIDSFGNIHVNRSTLSDVVSSDRASDCYTILNDFKEVLSNKATSVSLDPMNYVDKVVVAYKNPGKNFAAPYITSIYSGMLLDEYC